MAKPVSGVSAGERSHLMDIEAPVGVVHESEAVMIGSERMRIQVLPLQFQQRETLQFGGPNTQTLYTLSSPYREDMRASFVLRERCCTQRVFQIVAIIPSDRRDALDMTCVTNG